MNTDKTQPPFSSLFEQAAQISKAAAYDILSEQVGELKEENKALKEKNKQLADSLMSIKDMVNRIDYHSDRKLIDFAVEIASAALKNNIT